MTRGTLSIAGAGMITVAASNSGWRINATQSVQPETQTFIGGIQNSQTTYTSGTVNLSVVAGNLTIRSTTGNQFQFSVETRADRNTDGDQRGREQPDDLHVWNGEPLELGAITIRSTTGNQDRLGQCSDHSDAGDPSAGVSTGGNTPGNTTVNTGSRIVFVGTNNITPPPGHGSGCVHDHDLWPAPLLLRPTKPRVGLSNLDTIPSGTSSRHYDARTAVNCRAQGW